MRISGAVLILSLLSLSLFAADAPKSSVLDDQVLNAIDTHLIDDRLIAAYYGERLASDAIGPAVNNLRTDQQLGASSQAPNTTSVVEKPGIAELLSLALERGAITKASSGTGLTLSTTPYAISTFFGTADTPQRWAAARAARSLSVNATFTSEDVTKGDFSSFASGEVKFIAYGHRSPRDPKLVLQTGPVLRKAFHLADEALDNNCEARLNQGDLLLARSDINTWLAAHPGATPADVKAELNRVLGAIHPDEQVMKACFAAVLQGEKLIATAFEDVRKLAKAYLASKPQQLSFAGLFTRDATTSDYYTAKVLYAYDMKPWTVNVNGQSDWNKNGMNAAGMHIGRLRSYSWEVGANGATFADGRLDGELSSKWTRTKDTSKKSSAVLAATLNVHVTSALRLPLVISYNSRKTDTVQAGWQFNFGLKGLLDDILRNQLAR